MTYALGLTGGIGSGKSTVARCFESLGVNVVDADAIVREIQAPGSPCLDEIASEFGPEVIDRQGALDRAALARIVFNDSDARRRLGLIVHPKVGIEMLRRVQAARDADEPMVIADIPLLMEGRREGRDTAALLRLDAVLVVWVPVSLQIERTMARDRCTREEAQARIDAQMPIDEKKAMADHVIDNTGSEEETRRQVQDLYDQLTKI